MKESKKILSTKRLATNQKQFLLNASVAVVEADFIEIQPKTAEVETIHDHLIFTSQNAVASVLKSADVFQFLNYTCFCVGIKTKTLLEQNGFRVIIWREYAEELSEIIVKEYADKSFTFFSGNLRRETIPFALQRAQIKWNEKVVYDTILTPHRIEDKFDGILFFSPSGVTSFLEKNTITTEVCFCIGKTTAETLPIMNTIVIANQPTVESVIIACIKHFNLEH